MYTSIEPFRAVSAVVAIPVRDEAERIVDCLAALSAQRRPAGMDPVGVVLLVNNSTDATMRTVADFAPGLDCPVRATEHHFPPARANAGQARRLAMQLADAAAPPAVPLLTTDADGRVHPDWLAANLAHLHQGMDAVFGRAEIDPVEAAHIPPALHQADAEECAYGALLDEIAALIDPEPDDPWPRHTEHSGASIAVTRGMFHQVGGIPGIPLGEDRAFHAALRAADARIRHAMDVRVTVSGRILGRAPGGMADTIRRRLVATETMLDDAMEPVADRVRRLERRRDARLAAASDPAWLAFWTRLGTPPPPGPRSAGAAVAAPGQAGAMRRVRVADLPQQMDEALRWRDRLRQADLVLTAAV